MYLGGPVRAALLFCSNSLRRFSGLCLCGVSLALLASSDAMARLAEMFQAYFNAILTIQSHLDLPFISGREDGRHISRCVQKGFVAQAANRFEEFEWWIAYLAALARDLSTVADRDPRMLRQMRRALTSKYISDYVGARTELFAAAHLFRRNIGFRKQEAPDFSISDFRTPVYVECTSAHVKQFSPKTDLVGKFEVAISLKSAKKYPVKNLILLLDATNVFHHAVPLKSNLGKNRFRLRMMRALNESPFSSIIILTFLIDAATKQCGFVWQNFSKQRLDKATQAVIDSAFPMNRGKVFKYQIPTFS